MASFILLRESFSHMSAVSGFDPLFQDLQHSCPGTESIYVHEASLSGLHQSLRQRLLNKLSKRDKVLLTPFHGERSPSPFNNELHHLVGQVIVNKLQANPDSLAICSFGENQYTSALADADLSLRKRMFLCMHQPPSWHRLHWRDTSCLDGLGGIICLSEELARYMESVSSSPTLTIRHGVDLEFFKPAERTQQQEPRLLFVGQWLRDFPTLIKSYPLILEKIPNARLDCVIPRSARSSPDLIALARRESVHWHCDLSAEALRDLYQQATVLYLPLHDATANNAIVEALACGLPAIASDVGGISSYLADPFGKLCKPGDPESHAAAAIDWLQPGPLNQYARQAARGFAEENLAWALIAAKVHDWLH